MAAKRTSAGLLMYRRRDQGIEVLLVHPGGPFFVRKDTGAWTIPKGELDPGEQPLERAKIEFREELGVAPAGRNFVELGCVTQKGGKIVYAWAFEGCFDDDFTLRSNTFSMEWPPRSGKVQEFPEVDRAEFFDIAAARQKLNPAQVAFLDRLEAFLARINHLPGPPPKA